MYRNLAKMDTATTGTGTITLGSAVAGFLTLDDAGYVNNELVTYMIEDGNDREIGRGKYTTSGTTLTRDIILASTNAGAKISLSGSATVFVGLASEDVVNVDPAGRMLFWDDFVGGSNETGEIGQLGWVFTTGSVTDVGYTANHPGQYNRTNNSATNGSFTIDKQITACGFVDEMVWILQFNLAGATVANIRWGLFDTLLNYTNANGVGFEYLQGDNSDTQIFGVVFNGSSKTRTASALLTMDANWHKFKVRRVSSSEWAFSVDDGAEISITTGNMPDDTDICYAVLEQWNTTGTGSNIAVIDYFHLKTLPMVRF